MQAELNFRQIGKPLGIQLKANGLPSDGRFAFEGQAHGILCGEREQKKEKEKKKTGKRFHGKCMV
jgi:hypothetical protein